MTEQILIDKIVSADFSVALVSVPVSASWKEAIERKLVGWGADAQAGVNPFEFPAPTLASVGSTLKLLASLKTPDAPGVCPNGDGGVSFEWEHGENLHGVEVDDQGGVRETIFRGAKLIYSQDFEASLLR
jgi:hypothetical protein